MRVGPREVSAPTLVVVALAVAVAIAFVVGGATSAVAFSPFNPGWEGLSELNDIADEAGIERETIATADAYDDLSGEGTVVMIIKPGPYEENEVAAVADFLDRGGTVVIATRDPNTGGALLAGVGSDVAVDGAPLRDEIEYDPTPDFPRVTSVANESVAAEAEGMTLNHGTALTLSGTARPVANSSEFSYLNRTGEGVPPSQDALGARPVVAVDAVGNGTVIAVSDPSVFINAMLDREENRALATGIVTEGDRVVLDRSTEDIPPLAHLLIVIRASPLVATGLVVGFIGILIAWERGHLRRVAERSTGT